MIKDYDVFLSYSSKDKDEARQISSALENEGFQVFLSEKSIKPSTKWEIEIRDALKSARLMCLLATPNSLNSEWVTTEWAAAWALDMPILPILFQCSIQDLPDRLKSYQAVNLHEISKIVSELKEIRQEEDEIEKIFYCNICGLLAGNRSPIPCKSTDGVHNFVSINKGDVVFCRHCGVIPGITQELCTDQYLTHSFEVVGNGQKVYCSECGIRPNDKPSICRNDKEHNFQAY